MFAIGEKLPNAFVRLYVDVSWEKIYEEKKGRDALLDSKKQQEDAKKKKGEASSMPTQVQVACS